MRFILLVVLVSTLLTKSIAQSGCTDPQANNYDSDATTNDGSCTYELTEYTMEEVALLPDAINEGSGIESLTSGLWIHNDSGNANNIYRIDAMTGDILQTVEIASANNIDWEDSTEDENYFYIGDFGNNAGSRMNLAIHRISKSDLSNDIVTAEVINFSYSDQTDFTPNTNNNDYDCEALIFHNDSLHLFSKNWVDNQTRHYVLDPTPGTHTATLVESFNVEGLITGADISDDGEIVLLGYTEVGFNFIWLLFDYQGSQFFSGNKRRILLGTSLTNGQTEGITFSEGGQGFVCAEELEVTNTLVIPQKLLAFSIEEYVDNTPSPSTEILLDSSFVVYPNPFLNYIEVEISQPVNEWILHDSKGQNIMSGEVESGQKVLRVNTENLISNIYFLELINEGHSQILQLHRL